MKKFIKIISLALVAMTLLAVTAPSMAATLKHTPGEKSAKWLVDLSGYTTAPTYSIRVTSTPVGNTANVKLNYNDGHGSTSFKVSNTLGISGGMTEKTLKESSTFKFVPSRTDRAQIELIATYGTVTINCSKN